MMGVGRYFAQRSELSFPSTQRRWVAAAMTRSLSDLESEVQAAGITLPPKPYGKKELVDLLRGYHWESAHPGEEQPAFVEPMLLRNTKDLESSKLDQIMESPDWFLEQKRDGVRAMVEFDTAGKPRSYSRNVSVKTYLPGDLTPGIFWIPAIPALANTILDGEIISTQAKIDTSKWTKGKGSETGNVLQAVVALLAIADTQGAQQANGLPLRYVMYDVIRHNGEDMESLPYTERRKHLDAVAVAISGSTDKVLLNPSTNVNKRQLHKDTLERGGEGSVLKHKDQTYERGKRPAGAYKHKMVMELDALVTGFLPPQSGEFLRAGWVGGLTFSCKDINTGEWIEVGAASSMDNATRKAISQQSPDGTFAGVVDGVVGKWIYEVEFRGWSANYRMVHARPVRRRDGADADGKSPEDCTFDYAAVKQQVDAQVQEA